MRWHLVGEVRVVASGLTLEFRGRRSLDVLAVLLINRNQFVSAERLVDELWPEAPPASARNAVQRFISDIRSGLGEERDRLISSRGGYQLVVADDECDVGQAERLVRESMIDAPAGSTETLDDLRAGIAALSAPLCSGSSSIPAVVAESQRLRSLREVAIERAAEYQIELGVTDLSELERWHREFPFNERVAGHLMRTLASTGRQRDALAVHQQLRERLAESLGVSPGVEINAIELEILNQEVAPPAPTRSDGRHSPGASHALIERPLIGRAELLAEVNRALDHDRLVTLVGLGGVGKTSVATAIAAERSSGHSEPRIALLADLQDHLQVIEAVAAVLDLAPRGEDRSSEQLVQEIAAVAASGGLLVIDNAEHLITGVADLVARIVELPGPGRVLVTSRERLAVARERVVEVHPLAIPDATLAAVDAPSVQLFAARASAIGGLSFDHLQSDPASAEICQRLDGLPLALELAAAQLRLFSPTELLSRLKSPSHTLGSNRGPQRQSSLYELLDWSWRLLDPAEQKLLAELSVYRGWTAATVDYLAPSGGISTFAALVDKSFVTVQRAVGETTRYRMLETVRTFCLGQLESSPAALAEARARHAEWVLVDASQRTIVESAVCAIATRHFMTERPNLLLAVEWLADHDNVADLVRLLALTGGSFAHHGSVLDGRRWFGVAEKLGRIERSTNPEAIDDEAWGAFLTAALDVGQASGDLEWGIRLGLEAIGLAESHPYDWAPSALCTVAVILETGLLDHSGEALLLRAETIAPDTASADLNRAQAAVWRGQFEMVNRNYVEAITAFEEALDIEPRPGRILLLAETGIVVCLFLQQRYEEAKALADTMLSQSDGDTWHYVVDVIKAVAIGGVDPRAGARWLEQSLQATGDSDFEGRGADQRIATGILAWHGGDRDLCKLMLERPLGRGPAQVVLLTEYFDGSPGTSLTPNEWRQRYRTIMQRHDRTDLSEDPTWVRFPPDLVEFRSALKTLVD